MIIKFTEDFGSKKKGETWECDGLIGASIIGRHKAAKEIKETDDKKGKSSKKTEPKSKSNSNK